MWIENMFTKSKLYRSSIANKTVFTKVTRKSDNVGLSLSYPVEKSFAYNSGTHSLYYYFKKLHSI